MSEKEKKDSRRTFLKAAGAIGAGSIIATLAPFVNASDKSSSKKIPPITVPTRPFGKTGVDVSILSLGGVLGRSSSPRHVDLHWCSDCLHSQAGQV